ncbi:MAG TPA: DUF1554 domain-containing protein [Leptospiraceae bacterium]|nr:DUF1554 domain-containing protein [Leptospiraceae bacterium]HMX31760.1 DUF1554 domain-containing protein [Leptospiraceae bacterium]HMY30566.1 DUF1554 domain-containing protein [Leptospiraceae bacterium]HNA09758.1 DUF1554 domain-containing protein [Leptospiraceae bacterium]HNC00598.1 DUF1554 domain-containing protein [Leptospiraceae bacterium]
MGSFLFAAIYCCLLGCKAGSAFPKIFGIFPIKPTSAPAQFVISPSTGLQTSESGTSLQIRISLNKAPTDTVSIQTISFSDSKEGTIDKTSLIFTTSNWNTAQVITVVGVDDLIVDGDKVSLLSFSPSVSNDKEFDGLSITPLSITNKDDDIPGFTITPTSGLITSETATTVNFTISLTSEPKADVTIPSITSSNTAEGTVSISTITFTSTNWNIPQTITATGVDDILSDGNQTYQIQFSAASSSDPVYNGKIATSVSIINTDDETFGVTVTPTAGLTTTEVGGTASFNIVLNSASTSSVTIPISSSNTAEGTVNTSSLTFTPGNWNVPQTVTITGVNDFVADGNTSYTINVGPCSSANSNYQGLVPSSVSVTNNDNDTAGYNVVSGTLMVTDAGQLSSSFTIQLTSQPVQPVTVPMVSSMPTEATVSPSSIVFTSSNWNVAQTVTVSGVSDGISDGNKAFTIDFQSAVTTDTAYNGLGMPGSINAGSCDNDYGGVSIITACNASPNQNTTKQGATATYYLILSQAPTANVVVPIVSANTNQGTVSPASVTITSANWNQFAVSNQFVVTGFNNNLYDGDVTYTVNINAATSADPIFNGIDPVDITLVNRDTKNYFNISAISGNTTEAGGTANFSISLLGAITSNVSFNISSNNTAEGTVSPASMTFTSANWSTPQPVVVTGVDDSIADGNTTYAINMTAATGDPIYAGRTPASVNVINTDVGEKRTFITTNPTNGMLGGIAGADAICNADPAKPSITPNNYKALIAISGTRTGAPLTGWVLAANTKYFLTDGTTLLFTTNASSIFTFGTFNAAFSGTSYWTGLTNAWGPNGSHCTNWTTSAGSGQIGDGTATNSASIANTTALCNTTHSLICVQQ